MTSLKAHRLCFFFLFLVVSYQVAEYMECRFEFDFCYAIFMMLSPVRDRIHMRDIFLIFLFSSRDVVLYERREDFREAGSEREYV